MARLARSRVGFALLPLSSGLAGHVPSGSNFSRAPGARDIHRPGCRLALRNAFKAAERRLLDYKRRQRGEVKPHEESFAGQISQLYPAEDHGFLLTHEGTQLYFHRNSLVQRDFDALQVGDRVHFVATVGDTGPIASKVWRAEGAPG
jgi:cold shock CspA family protein